MTYQTLLGTLQVCVLEQVGWNATLRDNSRGSEGCCEGAEKQEKYDVGATGELRSLRAYLGFEGVCWSSLYVFEQCYHDDTWQVLCTFRNSSTSSMD